MFSVIISEKGGAERRETFDRTEINVGRVQGNDLMLPKGNVSKRHARLLFRDGRFIVTDLKSTNGTYVNGRKIAQATIVREGDKIYIGDFVLRIETASSSSASPDSSAPPARASEDTSAQAEGQMIDARASSPGVGAPPSADRGVSPRAVPQIINERVEPAHTTQGIVSHFPLENDPDEAPDAQAPVHGQLRSSQGPTVVPSSQSVTSGPGVPVSPSANAPALREVRSSASATTQTPRPSTASPAPSASSTSVPSATSAAASMHPSVVPIPSRRAIPPVSDRVERPPAEAAQAAAHRKTLARLIDRIEEHVDLTSLDGGASPSGELTERIEKAAVDGAAAMRTSGEIPAEVDADALIADARRELLKLGPIDRLLEDAEVSEIQVFRHDYVIAMQGRRRVISEVGFSSEKAVVRLVRRLCVLAGQPFEEGATFIERRLPNGGRLFAVLPPSATSTLVIRKPQRLDLTLEDLVRSGAISRAMAGLLSQCVAARGNILITGTRDAGTHWLLGALASAGHPDDRFVALQDEDELVLGHPHTVSITLGSSAGERARAVQAAARIRPDRLVIAAFSGSAVAEIVDIIGAGMDGVLAAARAPTLRQAVTRLTADLAAARPGITPETAREWLTSAFDLGIEIALLRDSRHRVLRISELAIEGGQIAIRDVFTFVVERTAAGGALEGTFHPSGLVPDIVEDHVSRGTPLDSSASFRRSR